jgi:hypothetical protein
VQNNEVALTSAEDNSSNVAEVCRAMFIEGARVLGFTFDTPLPLDAQAQILEAASSMVEGLGILLKIQSSMEREPELGN